MNAGQSIDEHLLTPLKVHYLENGDKEVTFQAVEPLELTTTSPHFLCFFFIPRSFTQHSWRFMCSRETRHTTNGTAARD